ncbi:MAG: hypothetical protein NTY46_01690 [Candidatus Sumerlaeota bacterium]|nr:hypothetical protein [Candidatus Sumerlaeota bacterium]
MGYRHEFSDEGIELTIDESVLDHVAQAALSRGTGARGLASVMEAILEGIAYEHFGSPGEKRKVRVRMIGGEPTVEVNGRPEGRCAWVAA